MALVGGEAEITGGLAVVLRYALALDVAIPMPCCA
jgi:hypothetical protein